MVVTLSGLAAFVVVSVSVVVALCAGFCESVTLKVKAAPDTAAVGVPVMAPVAAFSDSPAGKVPLVTDQAYGACPPDAANEVEYAAPTCPFGSEVVVMTNPGGEMTNGNVTVLVADCGASVCSCPDQTVAS